GIRKGTRVYEQTCCLRAIQSVNAVTADWVELPGDFLRKVSSKIVKEVLGINRVVFDISTKPPATIEWE
ncbi:MAG: GMP synthase (glutamine-hydrolyzing), partial [Candidatus Cloacimonetes bacterium]|nr:GMP synthase (glutamine-hydrolyzing) [Candidatus Cloacimonadota bacterium]